MLFDVTQFLDSFSAPAHDNADAEKMFNKKRKAWHQANAALPRCDFHPDRFRLNSRGVMFISLWRRSLYGQTLTEIKQDPIMPQKFIEGISPFIKKILGQYLQSGNWALITPPPRRHLTQNFAESVAKGIAANLGIPFRNNVASAKNRQRINAEYTLVELPPESNIIVFDDICTTGSTLQSMDRLLRPLGKNLIYIVGINNKE